ncbi:hypothetical protein CTAYLR_001651 [Chrysophaeum taylorii]|uniref:Multidrug and toxin extrusion protein n=1 Tax=Chrysophaeum taylorii TaxID=2483200 RepID=A0AAD7UD62_9STRA|nr:hypothetical protein CTAYLR_001651 [Chrysophaeum taylorii]
MKRLLDAQELRELVVLSSAYFVASASFVAMKTTDTAIIGHVGTRFLDATAYSDLYTASTGVLIQGRVLGVFCSQAFGAGNYDLVNTWLKVSCVFVGALAVPVTASWLLTPQALSSFGVPPRPRRDAGLYARILCACIPARVGFNQLSQYFTAQKVTRPSYVSVAAVAANAALGLGLVFGARLGFAACPAVTSAVEYVQLVGILLFFGRPTPATLSDVTRARLAEFAGLYVPAVLAVASDFWRLSAVGAIAATISQDSLGVFNASYRIMWLTLTIAGSLGAAVGTKVAIALGANEPRKARRLARLGISLAVSLLFFMALLVFAIPRQLALVFTSDENLVKKFVDARSLISAAVFFMNLAVVLERVPVACGRTRLVFVCGFVASWLVQTPAVYCCVTFWRRDLRAVYLGVALGYAALSLLYAALLFTSDFDAYAFEATLRSEVHASTQQRDDDDGGGGYRPLRDDDDDCEDNVLPLKPTNRAVE